MKFTATLTLLFFLFKGSLFAQNPGDTIVVNTFNYSQTAGSGIRDTMINFPNLPGVTFERIIMKYNMRCKNGLVSPPVSGQTNLGCGEWDYSCNTYIHDSTRMDSVNFTTPSHTISGFTGTSFSYTNNPQYDYYQFTQQNVALNSIISETQHSPLSGTSPMSDAFAASNYSGKSQYLYTAAELTAAGLTGGNIHGFLVNALNGGSVKFLRINIKGTTAGVLDSNNVSTAGFTQVFFSDYTFVTGSNRLQFYTPYVWNGTDNLIIEVSFTNSVPGSNVLLQGTSSSSGLSLSANNGYYQNLAQNGHIDLQTAGLSSITNEVTVSFWAFGEANMMPANTSIIEGLGAANERDLNIHLPWSNGQMYWDCGGNPDYDRINKVATASEYGGQWNHWAFVKNATTGVMQIYLNGALWHSGTGKVKPIDIAQLVIGKSATYTNNYKGSIDELHIWNKALSASVIQNWMNVPLNSTHPNYINLVAYYPFDEGTGLVSNDLSPNSAVGTSNGSTFWSRTPGNKLNRFFKSTGMRPSLTLVNGTYNSTVTPVLKLDSTLVIPNTLEAFAIVPHPGLLMDDDVITVSSFQVWQTVGQKLYDGETGVLISSTPTNADSTITPTALNYLRRFPMKFEIMSFVTPYGINLNLGQTGKTWTFDMTDFTPILKGMKRMTMERGGQRQEDMDIKFLFIVGTPQRDIVDIREIWRTESRSYTAITNNTYFEPINVPLAANGNKFVVKTAITGHGQEGEFIPQTHFMNVNGGTPEFSWQVWKECAENPVYPQGGTWIYDRAGWCPGMATDVKENDITTMVTPGGTVQLDYGLNSASGTSNYIVSNKLITYGPLNHAVDGRIEEIKQPSNQVEYARINSICNNPVVVLKNTGSAVISSAKIKYWVNNPTNALTHSWTGSIAENGTADITLPSPHQLWTSLSQSSNEFHAEVIEVNGAADNYALNNHLKTAFDIPPVAPANLIIHFRTNAAGSECSYDVRDDQGQVVFARSGMSNNTLYKDTLYLPLGCFSYNVYDADDDGISFFANNDGTGYTRFYEVGGGLLKTFVPDYGSGFTYNFTVNFPLSYEELNGIEQLSVFPNPVTDELNITLRQVNSEVELILIDQLGKQIRRDYAKSNNGIFEDKWDMSELPVGIYFLSVRDGASSQTVKVVKQ
jgi:Concanavalin A-like lectin/glucanases superfamily/Peptide-N-glycosidase F, C terminal/Secretion system C-terminal sorting domain